MCLIKLTEHGKKVRKEEGFQVLHANTQRFKNNIRPYILNWFNANDIDNSKEKRNMIS